LGPPIVERGHLEFPAQRRRRHGDGHARVKIGATALGQLLRADGNEDVKIAGRYAPHPRLPLLGEADAGAVLDAFGDVDRELAMLLPPPLPAAIGAGLVHHLAPALADRTGALDGEEALRRAHLAVAVALPAGMGAGARLGARALAGVASRQGRHVDLIGAAPAG